MEFGSFLLSRNVGKIFGWIETNAVTNNYSNIGQAFRILGIRKFKNSPNHLYDFLKILKNETVLFRVSNYFNLLNFGGKSYASFWF